MVYLQGKNFKLNFVSFLFSVSNGRHLLYQNICICRQKGKNPCTSGSRPILVILQFAALNGRIFTFRSKKLNKETELSILYGSDFTIILSFKNPKIKNSNGFELCMFKDISG